VKHGTYQPWDDERVKFGLQISQFTWPGGASAIGPTLARVARTADGAGFDSIWVMDHFFQIRGLGPPEAPMLEGQTTLGFLAAQTERARIGLMVGGVHHRDPGLWIKAATTLDVLSGGRAWFGIGAAWNVHESKGLGFAFPPLRERFELLEDTLEMAHAMWSGGSGTGEAFEGRRVTATHLINSPQSISRPRVPILVGGGGERKTLRLVARYADACNIYGRSPEFVAGKLAVLREHCDREGRPYDEIERTVLTSVDPSAEEPDATLERFAGLAEAGAQHIIFSIRGVADTSRIERIAADVLPRLRTATAG
jgi:F420-dependent oxidoreductase-like protein